MKNIKNSIASFIYKLLIILVKILPATKGDKHLLIVKLDEIGDYMLFRKFLKYLRTSDQYRGYKITLLGNAAWKSIFDMYDSDTVDASIWITKKKLNSDLVYRFSVLRQVRNLKTSDVINGIFSRSFALDDGFSLVATGSTKIAMKGDNVNKGKYAINIDSVIYNTLLDSGDEKLFDSVRNANFVSQIIKVKSLPIDSMVDAKHIYPPIKTPYCVIFIGAGNPERKWPVDCFLESIEYAWSKYNLIPVICGGGQLDQKQADEIDQKFSGKAINLANKTTLPEFMDVLSNAKFMISVDTGPLHMGMAVGCNVIGLYSGKFYQRYSPYPNWGKNRLYPVYPDFVDKLIAEKNPVLFDPFVMKNDTIKQIPASKILPVIDTIMG